MIVSEGEDRDVIAGPAMNHKSLLSAARRQKSPRYFASLAIHVRANGSSNF